MHSVVAAAAPPFGDIQGFEYLAMEVLVGALLPFAVLSVAVMLSRSSLGWGGLASALLAVGFLGATVVGTLAMIVASRASEIVGAVSVTLVGLSGLALAVVLSLPSHHPGVFAFARWELTIVSFSLVLGAAGLFGFWVLDSPVTQNAVYQGVGPGNLNTFEILLRSRNQVPMALSILAAGLGAIAWRATGRVPAAAATTLGCIAIGVNFIQLLLQNAD